MNPNVFANAIRVDSTNSPMSINVDRYDLKKRLRPSDIANLGAEKLRRTVCTEGTRVRILDDLTTWAFDTAPNSASLYWLSGSAGSGKTTIAYTLARLLEASPGPNRRKVLGGNFFCSRQFPETKLATRILPTIVYHLALACNAFADALNRLGEFDTVGQDVKSQLVGLLIRPWAESEPSRLADPSTPPYYTIIIDALDEIDGTGGSEFLSTLLDAIEGQHLPGLKFFVTCPPDPGIVDRIGTFPRWRQYLYRLGTVSLHAYEARNDIRKYLVANLPDLRVEVVEKLVNLADGLFIYAATIVKYLDGYASMEQEELLDNIISATATGIRPTAPTFEAPLLDELYRRILEDAFRGLQPAMRERRLQILHTFLCTAERTSAAVVADLLADSPNQTDSYMKIVNDVLGRLHPVLYSDGGNVLWYHKSFPDFIFAQARSQGFWCNQTVLHRRLTDSCFRVMKHGLRFNIADIPSSYALDSDNATLLDVFRRDISRVLVYACHYWSDHLAATSSTIPDPLVGTLEEFLQLRGLFWIEAMNLLQSCGLCDPMLRTAGEWAAKIDVGVADTFYDAATFALYFSISPASSSTPHLYISALATSPVSLDHWKSYFPGIPQFPGGSRKAHIGLPMTLEAGGRVDGVAVSRDGKPIVSGSSKGLVQVWSATKGEEQMKLNGHTNSVAAVAFSNDGTRIVSGSWDRSVRVWNAKTGEELAKMDGHAYSVTSVAFSNDGTRIASGSLDPSVRLWNAKTGEELAKLDGLQSDVTSVAFSNDGTRIVFGLYHGLVGVWNTLTRGVSATFSCNHVLMAVAFSNDVTHIVSGASHISVAVWNANTGARLELVHSGWVRLVAFSNDGTRIVSGSDDQSVRVWNANTGEELMKLLVDGHNNSVTSVAFSNDSTCIVSGCGYRDNSVRVWNATTGVQLAKLHGHSDSVTSVAFSNDGTRIVSGSHDNSVRVWSAGEELAKLDSDRNEATSVAFSNDNTHSSHHTSPHFQHFQIPYIREQTPAMQYTGWLLSPDDSSRLMFVPLHAVFPDSSMLLCITPSASVNANNACLGPLWANCYLPTGSSFPSPETTRSGIMGLGPERLDGSAGAVAR